ncbi:MAG: hypothetical protein GC162_06595 [Planctomycetes bacterium]|nr:hypothetical protein [Planctomycetota bacterium]
MIRKLVSTVILLALGAAAMYWALGHYIVVTADKRLIVPKATMTLTDTYVDIKDWTPDDFKKHEALTQALIDNDHEDLVLKTAGQSILDAVKEKAGELLKKKSDEK